MSDFARRTLRALQAGLRWLKQTSEAVTDPRDLAITIEALLAAERNKHSHAIQRLTSMLVRAQAGDGSWNNEVWDTAWAIKALHDAGLAQTHPSIAEGLMFLDDTRDAVRGTWYEEPFETMLVLDLYASIAPARVIAARHTALEWLLSLQDASGRLISTHYTGMLVSLLRRIRIVDPLRFDAAANRGCDWLIRQLEVASIWTEASWSNCYGLKALLDSGYGIDTPAVATAVEWFLTHQDLSDGKWAHVARVDDTAMAVLVLAPLLSVPLVDLTVPKTSVVSASRENGTVRVSFQGPTAGAMLQSDRVKLTESVWQTLRRNQQAILTFGGTVRRSNREDRQKRGIEVNVEEQLTQIGRYAYGNLVTSKIRHLLDSSNADHLRLDIDERLIDLPWELVHDNSDFLCLKYAIGRRVMSDQEVPTYARAQLGASSARALVVANPTGDLPSAESEGEQVATLLEKSSDVTVAFFRRDELTKMKFLLELENYDIVHFAGHASYDKKQPDESSLEFCDGPVTAFELQKFLPERSPAIVFLNACWSAEARTESYQLMIRGLGRTFLYAGATAFLGYIVPVPDDSATQLAIEFYRNVVVGQTIGESLRRSRLELHNTMPWDVTWSSAVLYGDPAVRAVVPRDATATGGSVA